MLADDAKRVAEADSNLPKLTRSANLAGFRDPSAISAIAEDTLCVQSLPAIDDVIETGLDAEVEVQQLVVCGSPGDAYTALAHCLHAQHGDSCNISQVEYISIFSLARIVPVATS